MHTKQSMAEARGVSLRSIDNYIAQAEEQEGRRLGTFSGSNETGTRVFSEDEKELILSFCQKTNKPVVQPSSNSVVVESSLVPITEVVGLDFPRSVSVNAALSVLDGAKGLSIGDAKKVVDQVEDFLEQVEDALADKVERQRAQVEADNQQLYRLRALKSDFQETAAELGTKSKRLARVQTSTTEDLRDVAQGLLDLGQ